MKESMLALFKTFISVVQTYVEDEYGIFIVLLAVCLIAMGVDYLLGTAGAWITDTIKSGKMGDGLIKKGCILMVLVFVMIMGLVLPDILGKPLIVVVFIWEMLNEFISIVENLAKMGVDVKFLQPILNKLEDYVGGQDDENSTN